MLVYILIIHFAYNYNVWLPVTGAKFGYFRFAKVKKE